MEKHFDPEMEALKEKIANLPLEDYVTILRAYQPSASQEKEIIRKKLKEKEIHEILLERLKSFPMNEGTMRTLFKTLFSVLHDHASKLDNFENLQERVEHMESDLETLEKEFRSLDSALRVVEEKVKRKR